MLTIRKFSQVSFYLLTLFTIHQLHLRFNTHQFAYINTPFDKQLPYFPEFAKWKKKYQGKFNLVFINYGDKPFVMFSEKLNPDEIDEKNRIFLDKMKSEEITEFFFERGYRLGKFEEMAREELERI